MVAHVVHAGVEVQTALEGIRQEVEEDNQAPLLPTSPLRQSDSHRPSFLHRTLWACYSTCVNEAEGLLGHVGVFFLVCAHVFMPTLKHLLFIWAVFACKWVCRHQSEIAPACVSFSFSYMSC